MFPNMLMFNALRDLTATLHNVGHNTCMLRARTMHENVHA